MENSSRQNPSACLMDDFRCRLCLGSSNGTMRQLFPPDQSGIDLVTRIFECLAIHLSFLDEFCSVICTGCRNQIEHFFSFKKQCQANDEYLRQKRKNHSREPALESLFAKETVPIDPVREPEESELLQQTEEMFGPVVEHPPEPEVIIEEEVHDLDVDEKDVKVVPSVEILDSVDEGDHKNSIQESQEPAPNAPAAGAGSSEAFRGFPLEAFSRRSPRIFVRNSITEAFERQNYEVECGGKKTPFKRQCKVALQKMDIKPNVALLSKKRSVEQLGPVKTKKERPQNRYTKNSVLYYQGYQFTRPKVLPTGELLWSCSNARCLVKLKKLVGEIVLGSVPHRHRPHVLYEGKIMNKCGRRNMSYLVAKTGKKLSLVYNNAFRFEPSSTAEGNERTWTCVKQPEGCKSYMKIAGDFEVITRMTKHNHPADKLVLKGVWNGGSKQA